MITVDLNRVMMVFCSVAAQMRTVMVSMSGLQTHQTVVMMMMMMMMMCPVTLLMMRDW